MYNDYIDFLMVYAYRFRATLLIRLRRMQSRHCQLYIFICNFPVPAFLLLPRGTPAVTATRSVETRTVFSVIREYTVSF